MGSSSSSHVKDIHLQQNQAKFGTATSAPDSSKVKIESSAGPARHKSLRNSKVASGGDPAEEENEPSNVRASRYRQSQKPLPKEDSTQGNSNTSQDAKSRSFEDLDKQLTESESQRLDLEDRVQYLEEQLEYYNKQDILKEEKSCDETLHAKDQYIAKLEKEKVDMETETNKLKQRSRKKIKMLSSKLSEFKQEANFQMMELREEIARLKEENLTLQGSAGGDKEKNSSESRDTESIPGGGKMKLILELSAQVTEQNEKISKLEKKLKDKDLIVDELRVKLKNNMEYLKARDEAHSLRNGSKDKNNSNHTIGKTRYLNSNQTRTSLNSSKKFADPAIKRVDSSKKDMTSQFAVNEEDSDDEFSDSDKMDKLTSLLHGVKAKNDKTRLSTDSLDDNKNVRIDDHLGGNEDESEARKLSGTSRDSGVGSAGKQRQSQTNNIPDYDRKEPSFSLESGLSDSDNEYFSHSKIASAPPSLERTHPGQKVKKTSSLKRRVSQNKGKSSKRPHIPKPSLAFVKTNDSIDSVIADESVYKLPGLSSVQVS